MKLLKFGLSVLCAALFAVTLGAATMPAVGIGAFAVSTLGIETAGLRMGITPEIWTDYKLYVTLEPCVMALAQLHGHNWVRLFTPLLTRRGAIRCLTNHSCILKQK
jgi:hypothetical protein